MKYKKTAKNNRKRTPGRNVQVVENKDTGKLKTIVHLNHKALC